MKEDAVIFDIDGTLSDHSHRIKYLIEKHDHKLYYSLCTEHPVFQDVLDILNTYKIKIIMLTGRPERLRTRTSCWLAFNHIKSDLLIMRPDYNYEKDFIVKERELLKLEKKYNIVCAYDDREKNTCFCICCHYIHFTKQTFLFCFIFRLIEGCEKLTSLKIVLPISR